MMHKEVLVATSSLDGSQREQQTLQCGLIPHYCPMPEIENADPDWKPVAALPPGAGADGDNVNVFTMDSESGFMFGSEIL